PSGSRARHRRPEGVDSAGWERREEGHDSHLQGRGRTPGAPGPALRHRRGAGPVRRPAGRHPAGGRPGPGGGDGRRPADLPRGATDQRDARGPGHSRADRGGGTGRGARRGGGAVPGATDPGGGAVVTELTSLPATRLAELIASGEVSAVEVTRAHLDRIAATDEI